MVLVLSHQPEMKAFHLFTPSSSSFPVFWQVLIECSVTSFWADSHNMCFKHTNTSKTKPLSIIRIEVWFYTPYDEDTVSEILVRLNHLKWLSAWSFTEYCYCESFTTCNCGVGLHKKILGFICINNPPSNKYSTDNLRIFHQNITGLHSEADERTTHWLNQSPHIALIVVFPCIFNKYRIILPTNAPFIKT